MLPFPLLCLHIRSTYFPLFLVAIPRPVSVWYMWFSFFLALHLEDVQKFFKPVIQQASGFEMMFKQCKSSQWRGPQAPCVIVSNKYYMLKIPVIIPVCSAFCQQNLCRVLLDEESYVCTYCTYCKYTVTFKLITYVCRYIWMKSTLPAV